MIVRLECPCGASVEVEDASEIAAMNVIGNWSDLHSTHRRSLEEYEMWLDRVHGRVSE